MSRDNPAVSSLRISPNGRYFLDAAGEPFFWLGDTAWELIRSFTLGEADAILRRRKGQGFTVLQVMLTGVGDGSAPNRDGETPWAGHDPAAPNEAYFRHADRVLALAREHGFIVVLGVYHQVQAERFTPETARAYARWVAERWREEPHLVWTAYPKAEPGFVPVLRALAQGLREGDGDSHFITVHPDPSPTSSSFIHAEPWLDFNMNQPCVTYELIPEMVRHDYSLDPPKPTVMAEGGYEGEEFGRTQGPLEVRKQAYWSHLAGGHHTYGHNDSWSHPEEWRSWIDAPGAQQMGAYRRVLTSLERWWEGIPDDTLIAEGAGEGLNRNLAARSASGAWVLAYVCGPGPVTLRADSFAGKTPHAVWIDPATGEETPVGTASASGAPPFVLPEGWEDGLLLLRPDRPSSV